MTNVLIRKLEVFAPLSENDKRLLENVVGSGFEVGARVDLIREGDSPDHVHLILEGFACRYKVLANGRRHNVAYLVPGDFCDMHVFILRQMDHSIATLSSCRVVRIARRRILELTERVQPSRERSGGLRLWTRPPCENGWSTSVLDQARNASRICCASCICAFNPSA